MQVLRKLLGYYPTVRRFEALLVECTPEERRKLYRRVYKRAMRKWQKRPVKYQTFFRDIVKHDWQGFLDYLMEETVLGVLGYPLDDPELFKKMCNLVERRSKDHKVSYNHFAFVLLLAFSFDLKISYLGDQIRTTAFYPEELKEVLGAAQILN